MMARKIPRLTEWGQPLTAGPCLTSLVSRPSFAPRMATIRELVEQLARRNGVDAVVVVARDGLPIDAASGNGIDPDGVAAMLPSAIRSLSDLGSVGARGDFSTGVLEYAGGLAVVAVLHSDAMLVILVRPETNVGTLLFDLRRHRSAIAGLL